MTHEELASQQNQAAIENSLIRKSTENENKKLSQDSGETAQKADLKELKHNQPMSEDDVIREGESPRPRVFSENALGTAYIDEDNS